MRSRRGLIAVTLVCGCFHPTPWTPEGQRLLDEREGKAQAAAPASEQVEGPRERDLGDLDGGMPLMGATPTVLRGVRLGPGEEWVARGYSDEPLPIGAEATCPPKRKLSLTVTDARGGVTQAAHLLGIYVARKQDLGGHFTVKLKNLEAQPVVCDLKIIALLIPDPEPQR